MENILIRFRLLNEEARALRQLANDKLRHPREQVRYILRRELERQGYLSPKSTPSNTETKNEPY